MESKVRVGIVCLCEYSEAIHGVARTLDCFVILPRKDGYGCAYFPYAFDRFFRMIVSISDFKTGKGAVSASFFG